MAIVTDYLGGTDAINGDVGYAPDVVETWDAGASYPLRISVLDQVTLSFASDIATTKTGLTYDSTDDIYLGSNGAKVLEMPNQAGGSFMGPYNAAALKFLYDVYTIYDECDDSSFDATKFTGSGVNTENTVKATSTESGNTNTVTLDANNNSAGWNTTQKFMMRLEAGTTSSSGAPVHLFEIRGVTSGAVTIDSEVQAPGTFGPYTYEIWVDTTASLATVYKDKTFHGTFDISGLVGNYYFRAQGTAGGSSGNQTASFYYVRVLQGDETTTIVEAFSANGGANYNTIADGFVIFSSNTGYATRAKLTSTVASDEMLVIRDCRYTPLSTGTD